MRKELCIALVLLMAGYSSLPQDIELNGRLLDPKAHQDGWAGLDDEAGPQASRLLSDIDGSFIENIGQVSDSSVRFFARGGELSVYYGVGWMAYDIRSQDGVEGPVGVLVRVMFEGCNPVEPEGADQLGHGTNYFIGNRPQDWRVGARSYSS